MLQSLAWIECDKKSKKSYFLVKLSIRNQQFKKMKNRPDGRFSMVGYKSPIAN
jgi:hypothetical protein